MINETSPTINFYTPDNKPDLGATKAHLDSRVDGETSGIRVSNDRFGNSVIESLGLTETILTGEYPSTMCISSEGADIVRRNRGLFRDIAEGTIAEDQIAEGTEGRLYKITLETPDGPKPYVVKYIYPIDRSNTHEDLLFTPGVDTMRLLQQLEADKPLENLRIAVPVVATIDITLAPYVEDSISLEDFYLMMDKDEELDIDSLTISQEAKGLLRDIVADNNARGAVDQFGFGDDFGDHSSATVKGLGKWLKGLLDEDPSFPVLSDYFSVNEPNSPHNLVVDLVALRELFAEYQSNPEMFDIRKKFDEGVRKARTCLVLVELTVSAKTIEETK